MTPDPLMNPPPDAPGLAGIIFAGINSMLILLFYLQQKARQDATDQELRLARGRAEIAAQHAANASQYALRTIERVEESQRQITAKVEESKQERSAQIADVKADVAALKDDVKENIRVSNNYNDKIAGAVEQSRQLREDFQNINTPTNHAP